MNNIVLLKYCVKNPEKFLDNNYMFVEKDNNLGTYVKKTQIIKHKLIAIKETLNKNKSKTVINQLFSELQKELAKYANYSEFGAFVNACDSKMEEVHNDIILLKEITYLYLKKRDLNDIVPSEWIQALIDKGSSRKKGHAGENKLIKLLEKANFVRVKTMEDFNLNKKCVAKCSKRGKFSNKNIKENFGVDIGGNNQDKALDLIIKNNSDTYILEAKHLNTGGGGQNKQILELIELIRNNTKSSRYHLVAFLDGIHSNTLLDNKNKNLESNKENNKIQNQYADLISTLKLRKSNYWINTAGFKKLFGIK